MKGYLLIALVAFTNLIIAVPSPNSSLKIDDKDPRYQPIKEAIENEKTVFVRIKNNTIYRLDSAEVTDSALHGTMILTDLKKGDIVYDPNSILLDIISFDAAEGNSVVIDLVYVDKIHEGKSSDPVKKTKKERSKLQKLGIAGIVVAGIGLLYLGVIGLIYVLQ